MTINSTDNTDRYLIEATPEQEEMIIAMSDAFIDIVAGWINHNGNDARIPASALGHALAILMSKTHSPDMTLMSAMNAQFEEYSRRREYGQTISITKH